MQKPRPIQFVGDPIHCVEIALILGWPMIQSLPGRHTSTRWERRQLKDWVCLATSLTGEACPSETMCCSKAADPSHDGLRVSDVEIHSPRPRPHAASVTIQVSSHCD
jgi:hypothetical protein